MGPFPTPPPAKTTPHRASSILAVDSPLGKFCATGNTKRVDEFIAKLDSGLLEEHLNSTNHLGLTALHNACIRGHVEVARKLCSVSKFIDINKKDASGKTAVHHACMIGNVELVRLILESDFQTQLDYLAVDDHGANFFHYAVVNGHDLVVQFLLKHTEEWLTPEERKLLFETTTKYTHNTLLHDACRCSHFQIVCDLLDNAPELINERNIEGQTPLLLACAQGSKEVVAYLLNWRLSLNNGTELSCPINVTDNYGRTPLHFAAANGHPGCIKRLLQRNTQISSSSSSFMTPRKASALTSDLPSLIHDAIRQKLVSSQQQYELPSITVTANNTPTTATEFAQNTTTLETANTHPSSSQNDDVFVTPASLAPSDVPSSQGSDPDPERGCKRLRDNLADSDSIANSSPHDDQPTSLSLMLPQIRHLRKSTSPRRNRSVSPPPRKRTKTVLDPTVICKLEQTCTPRSLSRQPELDINARDEINADTPLHNACQNFTKSKRKMLKVVVLLIAHGADPQALNSKRKKPIEVARQKDRDLLRSYIERAVTLLKLNRSAAELPHTPVVPSPENIKQTIRALLDDVNNLATCDTPRSPQSFSSSSTTATTTGDAPDTTLQTRPRRINFDISYATELT